MKNYINTLSDSEFFTGIPKEIILCITQSPACYKKSFTAGMTIYGCSQKIIHAGVILEGKVDIIHPSDAGHDTIVNRLLPGNTFGASFATAADTNMLNDIRSITDSTILFINIKDILHQNYCRCDYSLRLIENIMTSLAQSNIRLNTKIQILTQKTLREKIITYFRMLTIQNSSREITLPFNREQLACFLGSERSSVCRELSKLQEEGKIFIKRNQVTLLAE